jgi:hypothetical protein
MMVVLSRSVGVAVRRVSLAVKYSQTPLLCYTSDTYLVFLVIPIGKRGPHFLHQSVSELTLQLFNQTLSVQRSNKAGSYSTDLV